jgi:prepilin-type N-terminal cleavage/methylation domain-containing protein
MLTRRTQRGVTIIEVLLAITVFSLVSIGAMTIMNQGTNAAQRALEITLVREQIDGQAEALRAAQQAATKDSTAWKSIITGDDTAAFNEEGACPQTESDVSGSFIMDARNGTKAGGLRFGSVGAEADGTVPPYAQVSYDSGVKAYGMWIERTKSEKAGFPDSYGFTINACWYSAGLSTPMHLQTLVRLYDPTS